MYNLFQFMPFSRATLYDSLITIKPPFNQLFGQKVEKTAFYRIVEVDAHLQSKTKKHKCAVVHKILV